MTDAPKNPSITLTMDNLVVLFSSLNKPYKSKIPDDKGVLKESYSISFEMDSNDTSKLNMEALQKMMSMLSAQTQPKDIKDESGIKSTGRFKFGFNDKNPIPVYDGKGKIIPLGSIPMLGKGSLANVQFRIVQIAPGKVYKYIDAIQLVKVVEYVSEKPQAKVSFGDIGGFDFSTVLEKEKEKNEAVAKFENVFET